MAKSKFNLAAYADPMGVSNLDTGTNEVREIGLELIRPNAGNFYAVEDVDALADSIALSGLLQPLLVVADGGEFRLISGHRRFKALRQLYEESGFRKWDKAPCIVLPDPADKDREQLMLIHANSTGRILSGAEIQRQSREVREILVRMKEAGVELPGRLRDIVAEQMQVSASRLARLDAIEHNLAVPGMRRAWEAEELGESVAYEISQLPQEAQYRLLDQVIDSGKPWQEVSIKDIKAFADGEAGPTGQDIALACEKLGHRGAPDMTGLRKAMVRAAGIGSGCEYDLADLKTYAERLKKRYRFSWTGDRTAGLSWGGAIGRDRFLISLKAPALEIELTWKELAELCAVVALERAEQAQEAADASAVGGWKRVYSEEPEEGQMVFLAALDFRYSVDIAYYRDGAYVDRDGDGIEDVTSAMFWAPATLPAWEANP